MTDDIKSLLEDAAKAAGYTHIQYAEGKGVIVAIRLGTWGEVQYWNPLTDDGDALRLAVQLGISLLPYPVYREDGRHSVITKQRRQGDTMREPNPTEVIELYNDDKFAATRLAITKSAAEVWRAREQHSHCMCPACRDGTIHASDCSVHSEPAMRNGPCDCGVKEAQRD